MSTAIELDRQLRLVTGLNVLALADDRSVGSQHVQLVRLRRVVAQPEGRHPCRDLAGLGYTPVSVPVTGTTALESPPPPSPQAATARIGKTRRSRAALKGRLT
jgi:hypothetical protein